MLTGSFTSGAPDSLLSRLSSENQGIPVNKQNEIEVIRWFNSHFLLLHCKLGLAINLRSQLAIECEIALEFFFWKTTHVQSFSRKKASGLGMLGSYPLLLEVCTTVLLSLVLSGQYFTPGEQELMFFLWKKTLMLVCLLTF